MRILSNARVVLLDADAERRALLCAALAAFGMTQVLPAGSLDEARTLARAGDPQLCVVDPRGLPGFAAGPRVPPNPFDPARTAGILVGADTSPENVKTALAFGYAAVIGVPVTPRLLYRRIGSTLQKFRRAGRRGSASIVAERAIATAELRDG
jgi:DNA-binding response OmpR family regulator